MTDPGFKLRHDRVVGKRVQPLPRLHWPTPEEIRFMEKPPGSVLAVKRKGVVRYRSHAEADADMRELIGERMARIALEKVYKSEP